MMKKIIVTIALAVISMNSFAGLHMTCTQTGLNQTGEQDQMTGIKAVTVLTCLDKKVNDYTLIIKGYGIGFKAALGSTFAITCPTVSKRRLKRVGSVSLGAVKATAGVIVGADAVVAVNHRGGTCVMVGATLAGLSAGVSVGKMSIYTGEISEHYDRIQDLMGRK